jgi:hypothetical protein
MNNVNLIQTISDSIDSSTKNFNLKPNELIDLKEQALHDWCTKNRMPYFGGQFKYTKKAVNDDGTPLSFHDALTELFTAYCKNGGALVDMIPKIQKLHEKEILSLLDKDCDR